MNANREDGLLRRSPFGGSQRLALALWSLVLVAALSGTASLAAPDADRGGEPSADGLAQAAPTAANTVFVPLVLYDPVAPNVWQAEYFNNTALLGSPVFTREEAQIDYDWEEDSPAWLPDDRFSARWTGDWDFEVGVYTFFVYSDDGVRLWLDDQLVLDAWRLGMGEHDYTLTITSAGTHRVRVEYFEQTGDAAIQVQWRRTDLYPRWEGEYFNQAWVETDKLYDRDDSVVQFDWGEDCPDSLRCNSFSIRWNAEPLFETGEHRIYLYADQGYELYVDGDFRGRDGWYEGESAKDDYYTLNVANLETHEITYNFHDQGGVAEARLWIENLARPRWTVEYYNNMTLSGAPVGTEPDATIFHDWGLGRPHGSLQKDGYSVRWRGQRYFHAGFYRFWVFADDGVRLIVDGETLISKWRDGRGEHDSLLTYMSSGYHNVVVEYYENIGDAEIRFWWE